jgi:hypothetical protein
MPGPGPGPAPAPPPPESGPGPAPAPAEEPAARQGDPEEIDTNVEVKGDRYRVKLKNGSQIEGLLPRGVVWEKLDEAGDEYVECKQEDKGAGLRLHFVLNLEGELFVRSMDIAEGKEGIKNLGELTEEQRIAIREQVLTQRRRALEEREKAVREELRRIAAEREEEERKAREKEAREKGRTREEEEAVIRKGEELLKKFPPEEWSEDRLKEILRREVVNGIFRNDVEKEFIDSFKDWKAANERREKAGGEKKETPPEGGK